MMCFYDIARLWRLTLILTLLKCSYVQGDEYTRYFTKEGDNAKVECIIDAHHFDYNTIWIKQKIFKRSPSDSVLTINGHRTETADWCFNSAIHDVSQGQKENILTIMDVGKEDDFTVFYCLAVPKNISLNDTKAIQEYGIDLTGSILLRVWYPPNPDKLTCQKDDDEASGQIDLSCCHDGAGNPFPTLTLKRNGVKLNKVVKQNEDRKFCLNLKVKSTSEETFRCEMSSEKFTKFGASCEITIQNVTMTQIPSTSTDKANTSKVNEDAHVPVWLVIVIVVIVLSVLVLLGTVLYWLRKNKYQGKYKVVFISMEEREAKIISPPMTKTNDSGQAIEV